MCILLWHSLQSPNTCCYVIMDLGALIWPLLCDYGFGTPSFGRYHHGHFYGGLSQENKFHVVYYSQICYYVYYGRTTGRKEP